MTLYDSHWENLVAFGDELLTGAGKWQFRSGNFPCLYYKSSLLTGV
jgi:hypothetical protein